MLDSTAPVSPVTTVRARPMPDCWLVMPNGVTKLSIVTAKELDVPRTHIIEKNRRT